MGTSCSPSTSPGATTTTATKPPPSASSASSSPPCTRPLCRDPSSGPSASACTSSPTPRPCPRPPSRDTTSSTCPPPMDPDVLKILQAAQHALQEAVQVKQRSDTMIAETLAMQNDVKIAQENAKIAQKEAKQEQKRYAEMSNLIHEHFVHSQERTDGTDNAPNFDYGSRVQVYLNQLPRRGTILWHGCGQFAGYFRVLIDEEDRTDGISDVWIRIAECYALAG